MKYLLPEPMFFAMSDRVYGIESRVERGGPAAEIPEDLKCPSGRHNRRLTSCWCEPPSAGLHRLTVRVVRSSSEPLTLPSVSSVDFS